MPYVYIKKSTKPNKKLMATFVRHDKTRKTIHFGQAGAEDYTITIDRHKKNENWNNPETAGALSKWILWGKSTSKNENIKEFKKRFKYVN